MSHAAAPSLEDHGNAGKPNASHGAVRTRQRRHKTPPALLVPDIDEDAAERKRILNVLAQRRYRERKKQVKTVAAPQDDGILQEEPGITGPEGLFDSNGPFGEPRGATSVESATESGGTEASSVHEVVDLAGVEELIDASMEDPWGPGALSSPNITALLLGSMPVNGLGSSSSRRAESSNTASTFGMPAVRTTVNPSALAEASSSSSAGSPQSFPDSYLLPVHELSLLRALFRISDRINCERFWDMTAESPFFTGMATPADQLPKCLRPTQSQLMLSHHPFIDFLPWPSVREKVLVIFSLEDHLRPPIAVGPLALVNFAYDVEDNAEGVRIWGGDVFDSGSWEIGQTLFERWWFLFNREIVENSNRWRSLRGAPLLTMDRSISRC